MRQVPKILGDEKIIRFPKRNELRTKWKTILAIVVASTAFFSLGTYANQVVVQQVQSLAGNHVLVPAPELRIISSAWKINGTASLVNGVVLNLTTLGAAGAVVSKLYKIYIQVSCFNNATQTEFTCATGSNTIVLPVNMNGTSVLLNVPITPPIDPETIEIHDLSFIVTGSLGCVPDFTFKISPTSASTPLPPPSSSLVQLNFTGTFTSTCGFSGLVSAVGGSNPGTQFSNGEAGPPNTPVTPGVPVSQMLFVTVSNPTTNPLARGAYVFTWQARGFPGTSCCPVSGSFTNEVDHNFSVTVNVT